MRVLVDKYIPFVAEALQAVAETETLEPSGFTPENVRDADALFVRTRTRCDAGLLAGSRVRFIASATIGFDHIDADWCAHRCVDGYPAPIFWTACPGCNAQAVCDYVEEAIDEYIRETCTTNQGWHSLCLGIVGVGHVGLLVAQMAQCRGMKVLLNDPPKKIGVSLDEIAEKCDIVTFHTPLVCNGQYATRYLCNEAFLNRCKPHALIINAARGGIVDEQALLRSGHPYVLDCWENEPDINTDVLRGAFRASWHIAGYSLEGKMNASQMCLDAFCKYFSLPALKIEKKTVSLQLKKGDSESGWLQRISGQLKDFPDEFEQFRKNYILR